jgi:hypothetical protein
MRTILKQFLQFTWATCLVFGTGCGSQEPDRAGEIQLSLENPIIACQAQFDDCQAVPGASADKCRASMQSCLTSVATWVAESRRLLEQCRGQVIQCRRSNLGRAAAMCETQFDQCIAPAFRPREEDAGVDDDDAGVRTPSRRTPRTPSAGNPATPSAGAAAPSAGASGAAGRPPAVAGSGARASSASVPVSPFVFPALAPTAPADACGGELLECLASGTNLDSCATHARECLRASFGPGANR